jgi:integration host factor subunit beta
VTKKEIVKAISDQIGKPQTEVSVIVAHTIETIVKTLLKEGRVELRDFGVFQVKCRKPRQARNPRTGLKVVVPEKYVVTFKPGKELEERIQHLDDAAAKLARCSGSRSGRNEVDEDELDDSADLQTDDI